jgi:hypothetical protein
MEIACHTHTSPPLLKPTFGLTSRLSARSLSGDQTQTHCRTTMELRARFAPRGACVHKYFTVRHHHHRSPSERLQERTRASRHCSLIPHLETDIAASVLTCALHRGTAVPFQIQRLWFPVRHCIGFFSIACYPHSCELMLTHLHHSPPPSLTTALQSIEGHSQYVLAITASHSLLTKSQFVIASPGIFCIPVLG